MTTIKRDIQQTTPTESVLSSIGHDAGLTFLEQLTARSKVSCESPSPYFYKTDKNRRIIWIVKGACNMWTCPQCAPSKAKKWIARIIDGCNTLEPDTWYFGTVTAHEKWRGSEDSLKNIRANWSKLRKRLARLAKSLDENCYYVRVWEPHKDGSFHMHLLSNVPATTRWLKDNARQSGLGYQATYEEAMNVGQVAGYCAKYMLKACDLAHIFPKGSRRIQTSQNWVDWWPTNPDTDWNVIPNYDKVYAIIVQFMLMNYHIVSQESFNPDKSDE